MPDLSDGTNWFQNDSANNKAPPNGWPEGMMPSGVNDAARADKGALKRFWDKLNPVQVVVPSSGAYTFTTSNTLYPAGYVDGEIYSFLAGGPSVGNDTFGVNALAPLPIWKRNPATTWSAIGANDILTSTAPQLIYDSLLNGGAGAFVLLNPFVPILSDGAGGVYLDNVAILGALTVAGPVTLEDGLAVAGDVHASNYLIADERTTDAGSFGFVNGNGPGIAAYGNASAGTGSLTFNAGGTVRLTINAAGTVSVANDINAHNYFVAGQATTDAGTFGFGNTNGSSMVAWGNATAGAGELEIRTAGQTRMTISAAGGVNMTGNVSAPNYFIAGQATTDAGTLGFSNANGPGIVCFGNATSGAGQLQFNTSGATRMTINTAGLVSVNNNLYVANSLLLANAHWLYGYDTSNNPQALISLGSDNQVYIGDGSRDAHVHGVTVYLDSSLQIRGNNSFLSTGASAGYYMNSRDGSGPTSWAIYANGGGMDFWNNNGVFLILTTGNIWPNVNNVTGLGFSGQAYSGVTAYAFNNASDRKDKADIQDLPDCLDILRRLNPQRFKFTNGPPEDQGITHWGFVAQDVGEAFKGHDFGGHRADPAGETISYQELTAVLWKAVQELAARIPA